MPLSFLILLMSLYACIYSNPFDFRASRSVSFILRNHNYILVDLNAYAMHVYLRCIYGFRHAVMDEKWMFSHVGSGHWNRLFDK